MMTPRDDGPVDRDFALVEPDDRELELISNYLSRNLSPAEAVAVQDRLANDLEPAAERVEPSLAGFRREVEALVGAPALLAGSGSAYAVALAGEEEARAVDAAARLRAVGIRAWSGRAPAAP